MKGALLICITILLVQSCRTEISYKEKYTLVTDQSGIEIRIGKYSRNFSPSIQYILYNDSNYLLLQNMSRNSIEVYNLDTRKLTREVVVKREGPNSFSRFTGFVAKNLDTIILVSQMPQLVGLINSNGEVLKTIAYTKDIEGNRVQMTLPLLGQRPIIKGDTLLLSQFYRTDESAGIFTSIKQQHSYLNVAIDLTNGNCKFLPLVYPEDLIGVDISNMDINRIIGHEGCFLYHFGILNNLFVSRNMKNFEKRNIETNYNIKLPQNQGKVRGIQEGAEYKLSRDEVQEIFYDYYRECYYLITRIREDKVEQKYAFSTKFLYPHCLITILDKDFKHLGEVLLPDDTYSIKMTFITHEGLYISEDHINNPKFSEDYIRFKLFKLKKINN